MKLQIKPLVTVIWHYDHTTLFTIINLYQFSTKGEALGRMLWVWSYDPCGHHLRSEVDHDREGDKGGVVMMTPVCQGLRQWWHLSIWRIEALLMWEGQEIKLLEDMAPVTLLNDKRAPVPEFETSKNVFSLWPPGYHCLVTEVTPGQIKSHV